MVLQLAVRLMKLAVRWTSLALASPVSAAQEAWTFHWTPWKFPVRILQQQKFARLIAWNFLSQPQCQLERTVAETTVAVRRGRS